MNHLIITIINHLITIINHLITIMNHLINHHYSAYLQLINYPDLTDATTSCQGQASVEHLERKCAARRQAALPGDPSLWHGPGPQRWPRATKVPKVMATIAIIHNGHAEIHTGLLC